MRARFAAAVVLAVAGALSISCGGIVDPSKNVVETFTGTVAPQTTSTLHPVSTSNNGEFSVKITTMTPAFTGFIGVLIAIGPSDNSCAGNLQLWTTPNGFATVNSIALSGQMIPGHYCVGLYDIGTLAATETYTIQVSHP